MTVLITLILTALAELCNGYVAGKIRSQIESLFSL